MEALSENRQQNKRTLMGNAGLRHVECEILAAFAKPSSYGEAVGSELCSWSS